MPQEEKDIHNIEASELTIDELNHSDAKRAINSVINRISDTDIEQIKIYLGVVYFVALAAVTITLFV